MEAGVRRITDTWLYDGFSTNRGDFLLHEDGSWEESKGDEDVSEVVDGRTASSHAHFRIGTLIFQ